MGMGTNKKAIFRLHIDCGRMGSLQGVFIAAKEEVNNIIGKYIYWGEVLGKHSEVYGDLDGDDIELLTDDELAVQIVEDYNLVSGYNPFHYIDEDYDNDEEE